MKWQWIMALLLVSVGGCAMDRANRTGSLAPSSSVNTRIGKIDLAMGLPANTEVEKKLYDEMDFQRACQANIWATPIVAMNEWKRAHLGSIGAKPGDLVLY